jgi:hypothetical protein
MTQAGSNTDESETQSNTFVRFKNNCYKCTNRRTIPGSAHSFCVNFDANVTMDSHGVEHGWAFWPLDFDPIWVKACTGFTPKG